MQRTIFSSQNDRLAGLYGYTQVQGEGAAHHVHNPDHVCRGVVKMVVDGEEVEGNLVPLDLPGEGHEVEVWLGV